MGPRKSREGLPSAKELSRLARSVLETEAAELRRAARRVEAGVIATARIILDHEGKVVVCGIGKSGLIGEKIVATLCSIGTQAVFLHASEALHGDLGIYHPGDPTILISKSGATDELLRLVPTLRGFHSPLIALIGNPRSRLAQAVDVVLDASVQREADPLGIVPTSSTTVALAIGDALAVVLMAARKFGHEDFARLHPGGSLGRRTGLTVGEVMQPLDRVASAAPGDNLREVVVRMTERPQGAALVLKSKGRLAGIVTEGDLRRSLARDGDFNKLTAGEVMTRQPVSVSPDDRIDTALSIMENRASQISVLPVVLSDGRCVGLLRLHDIHQTRIA